MNSIHNKPSNININTTDNNTTKCTTNETKFVVSNANKYPQQEIGNRFTNTIETLPSNTFVSDFPEQLHHQHLKDIPMALLTSKIIHKWANGELKNRGEELANNITDNMGVPCITKPNICDIVNKLSSIETTSKLKNIGTTKILYDAFKKMNLNTEAEELLHIALISATPKNITDNNRNERSSVSHTVTHKPIISRSIGATGGSLTTNPTNRHQTYRHSPVATGTPTVDIEVLKNKAFPSKCSVIYNEIGQGLSIYNRFGKNWRLLIGKYGMNSEDLFKIKQEVENSMGQQPAGIIALGKIAEMSHKQSGVLKLYNSLLDIPLTDLATKLYNWAKNQPPLNLDTVTKKPRISRSTVGATGSSLTTRSTNMHQIYRHFPVTTSTPVAKPISTSASASKPVSTQTVDIEVLKNKAFPFKGSTIYTKIGQLLSIESVFGNDWRSLIGKYGMVMRDVFKIEQEAKSPRGELAGIIALGKIAETSNKQYGVLNLYNSLCDIKRTDLAEELYNWAKSQPHTN